MLLKRKRSESEFSFSSGSTFSSPPRPEYSFNFAAMDTDISSPRSMFARSAAPAHLPSRTMKRLRDLRPSEDEVHQRTLNLLFSAQRQQTHMPASPSPMQQPESSMAAPLQHEEHQSSMAAVATSSQRQSSLHSFWKLPSVPAPPPATISAPAVDPSIFAPANCEDCGHALRDSAGSDSMDVDSFGSEEETSCGGCGKHVCSHCSINSLGEQRRCLVCAGRKVWVEGLGWTAVESGFC